MLVAEESRSQGGDDMTNPLTSLTSTVIMGVILTVIMVAVLAAIS